MSAPKQTYYDLTKEAILALKERSGSSSQAIKKFIVAKYPTLKFAQVSYPSIDLLVTYYANISL